MVCHSCLMTNRGVPNAFPNYTETCWANTNIFAHGGTMLVGNANDMRRSRNRIRQKRPTDGPGEYTGDPVATWNLCNPKQKRLVCYHKLFQFLYGIGRRGVRIVLPSCCVLRIQTEHADVNYPADLEEGQIHDSVENALEDVQDEEMNALIQGLDIDDDDL